MDLRAGGPAIAAGGAGGRARCHARRAAATHLDCAAGDTLSGIAASFRLDGWQRLYDANRGVIGGGPNRIYQGQVLILP